jgi:hypothetical protein
MDPLQHDERISQSAIEDRRSLLGTQKVLLDVRERLESLEALVCKLLEERRA